MNNGTKNQETSKIITRFAKACGADRYLTIEHKGARRALILKTMEKRYLEYIEVKEIEVFEAGCPNLLKSNKRSIPVYENGKLVEYLTL